MEFTKSNGAVFCLQSCILWHLPALTSRASSSAASFEPGKALPKSCKVGLGTSLARKHNTQNSSAFFSESPSETWLLGYETQKPLVKLDGFLAVKLRSVPEARLLPSQTSLGKFALVGFCLIPEESSVDRSLHSDAPSRSHAHVQPTLPWVFCTGDGRRTCQQVGGVHLAAGQEQLLMDSATNG